MTATGGAEVIGVEVQLEGRNHLDPGDASECRLRFWAADFLPQPIQVGTSLSLLEGAKEVATGEVLADDAMA